MILAAILAAVAGSAGTAELDGLAYDASVETSATGFFRVEQRTDAVWQFVTPGGHGFYLAANNGPSSMSGEYCPALHSELGGDITSAAGTKAYAVTQLTSNAWKTVRSSVSSTRIAEVVPELDAAPGGTWVRFDHYTLEAIPGKSGFGLLIR